jgi:hypothetical protein
MRVALLTNFAASRKEPLVAIMDRVHQSFHDSGLPEPFIRFNFGDGLIGGGVSSVDRVLKRHPELARFVTDAEPMPGIRGAGPDRRGAETAKISGRGARVRAGRDPGRVARTPSLRELKQRRQLRRTKKKKCHTHNATQRACHLSDCNGLACFEYSESITNSHFT